MKTTEERQVEAEVKDARVAREREMAVRQQMEDAEAVARAVRRQKLNARLAEMPAAELVALRAIFAEEVEAGKHGELFAADFRIHLWAASGAEKLFRIFAAEQLIGGKK